MTMPGINYNDLASCSPGILSGVEENSFENAFSIYPNPAGVEINISSVSKINRYSIFDVEGPQLKSGIINSLSGNIDMTDLSAGIYVIECESVNGVIRKKFIKE
jgi:hypothetical protein